jgi:hypothetical protein
MNDTTGSRAVGQASHRDVVLHRAACAELRNMLAGLFIETQINNISLYHAIDSYEREPELFDRIRKLEDALKKVAGKSGNIGQSVMIAERALE